MCWCANRYCMSLKNLWPCSRPRSRSCGFTILGMIGHVWGPDWPENKLHSTRCDLRSTSEIDSNSHANVMSAVEENLGTLVTIDCFSWTVGMLSRILRGPTSFLESSFLHCNRKPDRVCIGMAIRIHRPHVVRSSLSLLVRKRLKIHGTLVKILAWNHDQEYWDLEHDDHDMGQDTCRTYRKSFYFLPQCSSGLPINWCLSRLGVVDVYQQIIMGKLPKVPRILYSWARGF